MTYSNQLPPMPEPHIGLPWRHNAPDGSIHSSAFTADQMHAYALQAQQLLATHVQGELPEPELGYIQTDKSNQPAFSARQMREAMKHALQARAQVQGEPVYWEWRHLSTHPDTVDFGKWSEWKRVEARSPIFTAEDELRTLRRYIADGYKYELRALYDHPAPSVPADVVRVPVQVLKDASEALGNFVSDHGWGDADMQAMDNLDAYIARHEANRAAMLAAK